MAPIAEKSKTVLIAISASAPAITNAGEYIYRVWPSDLLEGSVLAEFVAKNKYKKVCILYIQTDYGTGLRDAFKKTFEQKVVRWFLLKDISKMKPTSNLFY